MPYLCGLSLFSGIGGLDLAFESAGGNILAFCEIDKYCQKVLHQHWPKIPIFGDIRQINNEVLQNAGINTTVDIIYGGFPCQPFSVAGKQKGKDDTRYLWPEFSRLVEEIRPRWILAENVPGILNIAADDVCRDLESQGYEVGIWDYEAASVGARHRRERLFFVAHAGRTLRQRSLEPRTLYDEKGKENADKSQRPSCAPSPYSNSERCEEQQQSVPPEQTHKSSGRSCRRKSKSELGGMVNGLPYGLDESGMTFWDTVPETMPRTANGIPNRTNRLKALGNAVVPQQAYPIFRAIMEADKDE